MMRYRLERLRRRGDTATFSSNASTLRPLPGAAQLVALHRRITTPKWRSRSRTSLAAEADPKMQHGEWGTMVGSNLPFNRHTAHKLIQIVGDKRLTNVSPGETFAADPDGPGRLLFESHGLYSIGDSEPVGPPQRTAQELSRETTTGSRTAPLQSGGPRGRAGV